MHTQGPRNCSTSSQTCTVSCPLSRRSTCPAPSGPTTSRQTPTPSSWREYAYPLQLLEGQRQIAGMLEMKYKTAPRLFPEYLLATQRIAMRKGAPQETSSPPIEKKLLLSNLFLLQTLYSGDCCLCLCFP